VKVSLDNQNAKMGIYLIKSYIYVIIKYDIICKKSGWKFHNDFSML